MSGIASAIIGLGTATFGFIQSGKAKREARDQRRAAEAKLMAIEANRPDITDPFEGVENPYASMQVATQATEIAAEQADISLASSLDTLRATGASAGGATALARAAAQSKRGISADIEKQEMALQKLRAQGTMQYENIKAQSASAAMARQEARDNQQLNRQSSLSDSYAQQEMGAKHQQMGYLGAGVGAIGTFGAQGGFKGTESGRAWRGLTPEQQNTWSTQGGKSAFQKQFDPKNTLTHGPYIAPPPPTTNAANPYSLNYNFGGVSGGLLGMRQPTGLFGDDPFNLRGRFNNFSNYNLPSQIGLSQNDLFNQYNRSLEFRFQGVETD
jgi:hypothetical protein